MTLPSRFSARALAPLFAFSLAILGIVSTSTAFGASEEEEARERALRALPKVRVEPAPRGRLKGTPIRAISATVVHFDQLARKQAARPSEGPVRVLDMEDLEHIEEPLEAASEIAPGSPETAPRNAPSLAQVVSPSPTTSYVGLDDIPMADSLYIIIPPDCGGTVGPAKVMQGLNNNYRIMDKATGAVLSTVGTATFWAPSGETALNGLTDPRTLYDPYNDRWITVMQTVTTGAGNLLLGVSQTSDPSGAWYLYRFATGATVDFPIVGFNKNWISITINRYSVAGTFQRGINLVVNYPQARAGVGTGTLFTMAANSHFCSAPAVTYSTTEENLYVITHLASSGATYSFDVITGTSSAPVYGVLEPSLTRPGGGWAQPGGQILPQSAPNAGTSACSPNPCRIESQDAQIRSAPVYRNGFLYYAQTIGLPSGTLTRTAMQWTKLDLSGAFVDGGRLDDPTANATNGGKWYAYPSIAVNSTNDFIIGYSQFSSAQHPSAGYSVHLAADAAGTLRDPFIYKVGEDYYHKDFGSGRSRWGDYSQAQVDPSDDQTLWVIQEYAKNRVGTNDGTTGANSSRWSTYWAKVALAAPFIITATAGANGSITPSGAVSVPSGGNQGFTITPNPCYHVADVLVDGVSVGAVGSFTFNNVTANHTIAATFAINVLTISASAGGGGTITPSGAVPVNCASNQSFTISPSAGHAIFDVLVDGASVGAVGSFTFNNVTANHTIAASFVLVTYGIEASAGTGGTITPSGDVTVTSGNNQSFTIAPAACHHIADVLVDGVSQGAITSYTFNAVSADHTIAASFAPDRTISIDRGVIEIEGNSGTTNFNFPMRLSGPCSEQVDVTWKVTDGTAQASDSDFVPDSLVFSLAPGATTGTVTVHVTGDLTPEDQETFFVNLLLPVNAAIGDGQGQGTILNDDGVSAAEGTVIREVSFSVQGNPVGREVAFRVALPEAGAARLSVYDISGRRVAELLRGDIMPTGYHTLSWDTREIGSGVYFVRFQASGKTFVRRFVLLR